MQDIRKLPEYQRWRREVRQRDENTCRICGVQRNLHVHHIKPLEKYRGFATELDNGITLCGNCHVFLSGREESTNLQTVIEAITGQLDTRTVEQLKRLNDKFGDYLDTLLKSSDSNTRSNAVYKLFVHLQIYPDSLDQFRHLIEHILDVKSGFGEGFAEQIMVEFLENHPSKSAAQIISEYENECYQDGEDSYSQGDYATALKKLKPLAERGHVGAQHLLGVMYGNGTGVVQDYDHAMKWTLKAAEQGHDRAQCNLGIIYKHGKGVDKDGVEASKWFHKAAEQGFDRAQYRLGQMYRMGEGVDKDDAEAAKWFRKAAEQGLDRAQYLLGRMYDTGEGVDRDQAEAVKWFREAAEQGYDRAQHFLGLRYSTGKGVDKNDAEAVKWYRKAAEQGYYWAQYLLGRMYESGKGVDKDDMQAVKWYRKAAEQGQRLAQFRLEQMYENDKGVPEIDEMDLQGIAITRKDFFQRLSLSGIRVCLFTLETNNARIEIKDNLFTLSDIGKSSGAGMSGSLNLLFGKKGEQETKLPPSEVSDQLRGEVFLTKEDIPILKAFLAGIKVDVLAGAPTVLERVRERLDKTGSILLKIDDDVYNDIIALRDDVIALWSEEIEFWRDEIALGDNESEKEMINHLANITNIIETEIQTNLQNTIYEFFEKEIIRFLEALHQLGER